VPLHRRRHPQIRLGKVNMTRLRVYEHPKGLALTYSPSCYQHTRTNGDNLVNVAAADLEASCPETEICDAGRECRGPRMTWLSSIVCVSRRGQKAKKGEFGATP
jgi:hypothetical protein